MGYGGVRSKPAEAVSQIYTQVSSEALLSLLLQEGRIPRRVAFV